MLADWNIPKHLAKFDWDYKEDGTVSVKVYPHDTTGDSEESKPADKPWFQATFSRDTKAGLPFSTDLYDFLGVNTTIASPPLPHASSKYNELAGTDNWAAVVPGQATKQAQLQLWDLRQGDGDRVEGQSTNAVGDEHFRYFWPGLLPLQPGLFMKDAEITFSDPEIWKA